MPALGDFDQSLASGIGSGERPLLVAEEFAFDEVLRQGSAVHGHERHVGPRADFMNPAGDQFLAGAGFAEDQHAGVGRADLVDQRS